MNWWKVLKNSVQKFIGDNTFSLAATIAFYTIFSLPAISIISIEIAGSFYDDDVVRNQLFQQIKLLMGETSAQQIDALIADANLFHDSIIMRIVGIGTLLFSATTVFGALQQSLNTIWHIKPNPKKEIVKFFVNRLLSLAMVATIGFLLMTSMLADTLLVILNQAISQMMSGVTYYLVYVVNLAVSLSIMTLVFALVFKVLPDAEIKWKDTWKGAFITTLLFTGGKYLIGFYLSQSTLSDAYGAAGSLVALLAWVYYSTLILLFGAELTFVYTQQAGRYIKPSKHAVGIKVEEIEKQTNVLEE